MILTKVLEKHTFYKRFIYSFFGNKIMLLKLDRFHFIKNYYIIVDTIFKKKSSKFVIFCHRCDDFFCIYPQIYLYQTYNFKVGSDFWATY